jgi:carbonic anhydrase
MKSSLILLLIISSCLQVTIQIGKTETLFEFLNSFGSMQNPPETTTTAAPTAPVSIPPPATTSTPATTTTTSTPVQPANPNIIDLNDPNAELSDWLSISSYKLRDSSVFPEVNVREGEPQKFIFGDLDQSMNLLFDQAQKEGAKYNGEFWFRSRSGYIYYSSTKSDINVIGSIYVKKAADIAQPIDAYNGTFYCFSVFDYEDAEYKVCSLDQAVKYKWMCSLQSYTGVPVDLFCLPEDQRKAKLNLPLSNPSVEIKSTTQPVIIIPTAARKCNQNWNYHSNGKDWECQCSEGHMQSPIDLPLKDVALLSRDRPKFNYEAVDAKADFTSIDGSITAGENIKIRYDRGALRIFHPNMGKIVTDDGAVFQAEEISFHTPSEHTINGEHFDMEIQIVHSGRTKGDIAKQAVLSFLFKRKPGVYNKFIDKLDFFNLPNPTELFRDITKDLYIPHLLDSSEDDDLIMMKPFSFFTYEGSITSPPCTERTTHYVHADPLPLSNTVIQLFKEALRIPDSTDDNGNVVASQSVTENNRATQPLNDRHVTIYDHVKFHCPDYQNKKSSNVLPAGHYEKAITTVTDYIYVNGKKPSGLPDSYVVTENEAKGILPDPNSVDNKISNGKVYFDE